MAFHFKRVKKKQKISRTKKKCFKYYYSLVYCSICM